MCISGLNHPIMLLQEWFLITLRKHLENISQNKQDTISNHLATSQNTIATASLLQAFCISKPRSHLWEKSVFNTNIILDIVSGPLIRFLFQWGRFRVSMLESELSELSTDWQAALIPLKLWLTAQLFTHAVDKVVTWPSGGCQSNARRRLKVTVVNWAHTLVWRMRRSTRDSQTRWAPVTSHYSFCIIASLTPIIDVSPRKRAAP